MNRVCRNYNHLCRRWISTTKEGAKPRRSLPAWFRHETEENPDHLPRLPIPALEDTLRRYLDSVRPLVLAENDSMYQDHEALVNEFGAVAGRRLQEKLLQREAQAAARVHTYPHSYIERDWDDMYLKARYANPINVNPCYGLQDQSNQHLRDPLDRTSTMIRAMLQWWTQVTRGNMTREPHQCMSTLARQFGTSRIPQLDRDALVSFPDSRHIAILYHERVYILPVIRQSATSVVATMIPHDHLCLQLRAIRDDLFHSSSLESHDDDRQAPIAALTGADRNLWAQTRRDMCRHDMGNADALAKIDSALFIVVLDPRSPESLCERTSLSLHGHGLYRWFDKLQLLSYANGHLGLNFEHSFSDGTAWNLWLAHVWQDMEQQENQTSRDLREEERGWHIEPLRWNFTTALEDTIHAAHDKLIDWTEETQVHSFECLAMSKDEIKTWKLSPDGVVQMIFQLAFEKQHQISPPTYESCATRSFYHGRTETIRSMTTQVVDWIESMNDPQSSVSERRSRFETAIHHHIELAKRAQQGQGVDRHLMALQSIAREDEEEASGLAFFCDPLKIKSSHFQLSTSNVTMPFLEYFGFGAVVPDGCT